MWLLFVPVTIILMLVIVASLFAGVFWVLGATWPWLLIALGVWLFLHEDGRHRRRERWASGPRAIPQQSRPWRGHTGRERRGAIW